MAQQSEHKLRNRVIAAIIGGLVSSSSVYAYMRAAAENEAESEG